MILDFISRKKKYLSWIRKYTSWGKEIDNFNLCWIRISIALHSYQPATQFLYLFISTSDKYIFMGTDGIRNNKLPMLVAKHWILLKRAQLIGFKQLVRIFRYERKMSLHVLFIRIIFSSVSCLSISTIFEIRSIF